MKKIALSMGLCLLTFGFVRAETTKIACISLQELIFGMPEAKKADTLLQNFQRDLEGTYMELVKEYQQKDSIFRVDSVKWSKTTRDLKKEDLGRLVQQLQTWQQTAEQQLQKKQQELITPIRLKAVDAIQKVAQKHGYTQVIEKTQLYFHGANEDILELVRKELAMDAKTAKPKQPAVKSVAPSMKSAK